MHKYNLLIRYIEIFYSLLFKYRGFRGLLEEIFQSCQYISLATLLTGVGIFVVIAFGLNILDHKPASFCFHQYTPKKSEIQEKFLLTLPQRHGLYWCYREG